MASPTASLEPDILISNCHVRWTSSTDSAGVMSSEKESMLMEYCDEPSTPLDTVYGYVPVQTVTNVLAKHGGIVDGEVPHGVAPIPAKFTADI